MVSRFYLRKLSLLAVLLSVSFLVKSQNSLLSIDTVASISSSLKTSVTTLKKLINGNTSTSDYIDLRSKGPIEVVFRLKTAGVARLFSVYYYNTGYSAKNLDVSASNDSTSWDKLYSGSGSASPTSGQLDKKIAYLYYKFVFDSISNGDLSPTEIQLFGNVVAKPVLSDSALDGKTVKLNWTQEYRTIVQDSVVFELQRSTDGTNFNLYKTIKGTTNFFVDSNVNRSTQYWYMVRGVWGEDATDFSNTVTLTTPDDSIRTQPVLTTVQTSDLYSNRIDLSWPLYQIPGIGSIEVERSNDSTSFLHIATLDEGAKAFTDSMALRNTTYWYRIRLYNDISKSKYSQPISAITNDDSLTTAPKLTATATKGIQVQLSWPKPPFSVVSDATINSDGVYIIERSTDSVSFVPLGLDGKFSVNTKDYVDESTVDSTNYWYRIKAKNSVNETGYTTTVKITTGKKVKPSVDITDDGGTLFVSAENKLNGVTSAKNTEGSSKFIDNDLTTKWLVFNTETGTTLSAVYKAAFDYTPTGYTLSTTIDNVWQRDPKDWTFSASKDSTTWTDLDTQTGQWGKTSERNKTYSYSLAKDVTETYRYFRIKFTANNGTTDGVRYQVAEWQVYGTSSNQPDAPTALKSTSQTSSSVSLAWTAPSEPPTVNKYIVQHSDDGLYFITVDTVDATNKIYTDKNLLDSATYFYRIKSVGTPANFTSGWSNVLRVITSSTPGIPHTPSKLKIVDAQDSTVSLQWTDRSYNEIRFELERSIDSSKFVNIDTLAANTASYFDKGLWPGNVYYYRVRTVNAAGNSAYSNVAKARTKGFNAAPIVTEPVLSNKVCIGTGLHQLSFGGVSGGRGSETSQTVTVTNVQAYYNKNVDSASRLLLDSFSFNPVIVKGVAMYAFSVTSQAKAGDSATIAITVKDNGGTYLIGVDTTDILVKLYFQPLVVDIAPSPGVEIQPYTQVTLTASTNYPIGTTYNWAPAEGITGKSDQGILWARPLGKTVYSVTATTPSGCSASKTIVIELLVDKPVIANVLTPNGDGHNDTWVILGLEKIPGTTVKVFSRSGELVYIQKNYSNDWDGTNKGKKLAEGVYFYIVDPGNGSKLYNGTLTIVY